MNVLEAWVDHRHPHLAVRLRGLKKRRRGDLLLALVDRFVRPGDLTVDVGANRGTYTHRLSRAVGRAGHVVAVEPFPSNVVDLRRVWPEGGNVTVLPLAASDRVGVATLHVPLRGGRPVHALASLGGTAVDHLELEVATRPLDGLVHAAPGQRLSFVKVDVEGHELEVLTGALRLLGRHAPCVAVEVEERHRPGAVEAVTELMAFLGYRGFVVDGGALRALPSFDLPTHQREHLQRDGLGLRPGPGYLNDLVFVPAGQLLLVTDLVA